MAARATARALKEAYPNENKGSLMMRAGFSLDDKDISRAFSLAIWDYNNKNNKRGGYSLAA